MWTEQVRSMIGTGILETLYMTVVSTVFKLFCNCIWVFVWTADGNSPLYHR